MSNATATRTPTIDATIELGPMGMSNKLILNFSNGQTLTLNSSDLSAEIVTQALMHGLKQKLVDAAAIARNTETGATATVADKYAAVREVYDRLLAGEWNKRRGDGEGSVTLLAQAIARIRGTAVAETTAWLAERTDEERKSLRANARVVAAMGEIRAERAAAKGGDDSDDLLASLK